MTSPINPLRKNVIAPVLNVLVSGTVLLVLYRFLYQTLGIAEIGIWSLVLAAISVSRIGELGLSAGVVRFVAMALGEGDRQRAAEIVQTIVITIAVAAGLLMLGAKSLFEIALPHLVPQRDVALALEILPIALVSLWLMMVVSVFSGSLDGCLRLDLRSMLTAVSQVIYLALNFLLVPHLGLKGVAWAQLIQYLLLFFFFWIALRVQMKMLPIIPLRWRFSLLKEVFGYGVRFQVISIFNLLFEPLIKVMMSKFGGLEALGFYEMANRLILQFRAIITEATRFMVSSVAALPDTKNNQARDLFEKTYSINFYVAVVLYGLLGIATTSICMLWLGHRQDTFILFALILNIGWFVNTLSGPSYFHNLGTGRLGANMVGHVVISLISGVAGVLFGLRWESTGVVLAVSTGLIAGSMSILINHFNQLKFDWSARLVPKGVLPILAIALILSVAANYLQAEGLFYQSMLTLSLFVSFVGVALAHPYRKILIRIGLR